MKTLELPIDLSELTNLGVSVAFGDCQLAEELVQHVLVQFWRGFYNPNRKSFPAWARRVMRNYRFDCFQTRFRAIGGDSVTPDPFDRIAGVSLWETETNLNLSEPFSHEDLGEVRAWTPQQQLVLLGWTGLFGKLPQSDQESVLSALSPAKPFPVPNFLAWMECDRTVYLADALSVLPNTITQIRCRGRGALQALKFVQQLKAE